ncbi:MAG: GlsB/YeaQ/YmgE family stress response membrane protein [Chloroflexi bacterium]|nr:GlsB/YeaQ/YmgE family stress response membrane protein [Chloroflexota bacterium]
MNPFSWMLIGLITGWLASQIVEGGQYGAVGDIVTGIVGALMGGYLSGILFGGQGNLDAAGAGLFTAGAGAISLIFIVHALSVRSRA